MPESHGTSHGRTGWGLALIGLRANSEECDAGPFVRRRAHDMSSHVSTVSLHDQKRAADFIIELVSKN